MNCSQAEALVATAPSAGVCAVAASGLAASLSMTLHRVKWAAVVAALVATVSAASLYAEPTGWTVLAGTVLGMIGVCRATAVVTGVSGCVSFAVRVFGDGYPQGARVAMAATAAIAGGVLGVSRPDIALAWGAALTSGVLATFCVESIAVAFTGAGYCFMFGAEIAAACAGAGMYAHYRRIDEDEAYRALNDEYVDSYPMRN